MSLVKMHNKKTGVTYVYESRSYWDKEKKQPRNERKLIGKLDPITGEIIPTKQKSNSLANKSTNIPDNEYLSILKKTITESECTISELQLKIKMLEAKCKSLEETMDRIRSMIDRTKNDTR